MATVTTERKEANINKKKKNENHGSIFSTEKNQRNFARHEYLGHIYEIFTNRYEIHSNHPNQ